MSWMGLWDFTCGERVIHQFEKVRFVMDMGSLLAGEVTELADQDTETIYLWQALELKIICYRNPSFLDLVNFLRNFNKNHPLVRHTS